ncbi:hemolysin family protein [Alkalihalobacillus pseudalcaliphilus]|uniref:hemolysin family protein n=1 Tax=Alkalihalobacillus pseudalcaliphilus TaxID=79884 RepID=UPI00064DA95B|nr:CNNM domain-containing protein [Alkalihalobacillus pseudalcaliphilus]KMK74704.1 hemolysin [Alkalihalobacillus pseudalcaliphilus]
MILAIILLFIASAYFSSSETALTATNKMKLQLKAAAGDTKAERLLKLASNTREFIPGILIANNVPNIILPSLVTIVALEYTWHVGLATGILTVLIIIFAEVLPKSVAAAFPERFSYMVYYPTKGILFLLKPFTFLLNVLTDFVIKLLKQDGDQKSISKEEMRAMVDIGYTEGTFKNDEVFGLKAMLDFQHLTVSDVLKTPRVDVYGMPEDISFEDAKHFLSHNSYTRYPVYREHLDHITGVFHAKTFLQWSNEPEKAITEFVHTPLYVYQFQSARDVFRLMLKEHTHLAIVLDEHGGTEGIISHEDLIETMIGQDINDESDKQPPLVFEQTEQVIVCDSKITLHQLNLIFKTDIPEDHDNLANFMLQHFGYLPKKGEFFIDEALRFEVTEADRRKISKVKIEKLQVTPSE